jgi:hypothetical protein
MPTPDMLAMLAGASLELRCRAYVALPLDRLGLLVTLGDPEIWEALQRRTDFWQLPARTLRGTQPRLTPLFNLISPN